MIFQRPGEATPPSPVGCLETAGVALQVLRIRLSLFGSGMHWKCIFCFKTACVRRVQLFGSKAEKKGFEEAERALKYTHLKKKN